MNTLHQITALIEKNDHFNDEVLSHSFSLLYPELKKLADSQIRKLRPGQTITPTVLVNECYLKLNNKNLMPIKNRKHFICLVAKCMRQYLIDQIRSKNRNKRSGQIAETPMSQILGQDDLNFRLLELDQIINQLAAIDEDLAELTELRFFSGLTFDELSEILNISKRQLIRKWNMAKSFLLSLLNE